MKLDNLESNGGCGLVVEKQNNHQSLWLFCQGARVQGFSHRLLVCCLVRSVCLRATDEEVVAVPIWLTLLGFPRCRKRRRATFGILSIRHAVDTFMPDVGLQVWPSEGSVWRMSGPRLSRPHWPGVCPRQERCPPNLFWFLHLFPTQAVLSSRKLADGRVLLFPAAICAALCCRRAGMWPRVLSTNRRGSVHFGSYLQKLEILLTDRRGWKTASPGAVCSCPPVLQQTTFCAGTGFAGLALALAGERASLERTVSVFPDSAQPTLGTGEVSRPPFSQSGQISRGVKRCPGGGATGDADGPLHRRVGERPGQRAGQHGCSVAWHGGGEAPGLAALGPCQ